MNNTQSQLTFFVATDARNIDYVIPFAYFALCTNPNSCVEIHYTNADIDKTALTKLQCIFKERLICSNVNTYIPMNMYRYLIQPHFNSLYTYISDIDILICEDILNFHVNKMSTEYIYDNEIRINNTTHFSGLHFVDTKKWYEKTKNIRNKYIQEKCYNFNDEQLLLNIAKESNVKLRAIVKNAEQFNINRPVHGQHISLSRRPFKATSPMKNIIDAKYKDVFFKIINTNEFKDVISTCVNFKNILDIYLNFCKNN